MTQAIQTSATKYPLAFDGVWWSLQGEGHLRGFQMAFVRLAGCSVGCPSCDTDYKAHSTATAEEIAQRVDDVTPRGNRDRWVWITGGEPADYDLRPLIGALRAKRFSIAVATSGHKRTIPPVDWLSVSPHDPSKWLQTYGNEVKIVPGLNGFSIADFLRDHPDDKTDFMYRYAQPLFMHGREQEESLKECIKFLQTNSNWSLSRQDHRYWNYT